MQKRVRVHKQSFFQKESVVIKLLVIEEKFETEMFAAKAL
jgi:hypothetical protein